MRSIVECIPNFSEGRRTEVIDEIVAAITSVSGAVLLDRESDPNHNRSVVTFVASPDRVVDAAVAAAKKAAEAKSEAPVTSQFTANNRMTMTTMLLKGMACNGPNETKLSYRWRRRAWIEMDVFS